MPRQFRLGLLTLKEKNKILKVKKKKALKQAKNTSTLKWKFFANFFVSKKQRAQKRKEKHSAF